MSAQQYAQEIASRVSDLDAWESAESERRERVGESLPKLEQSHGDYANEISSFIADTLSRHPGTVQWEVGFSAHPHTDDSPTPVIFIHGTGSERDQKLAHKLIKDAFVQRGYIPSDISHRVMRPVPVNDGIEYPLPGGMWPVPRDIKWTQPGRTSAAFFGKPISSRGGWSYNEAFANIGGIPESPGPESRTPGTYFHGTEREFDKEQIDYEGDNLPGTFYTPSVRTAAAYSGAVKMTPMGMEERTPAHWSQVSPSSRVISAGIDTGEMPALSEADEWLRQRDVHPQDDPNIEGLSRLIQPTNKSKYLQQVVQPFWRKYQRLCEIRDERGQEVPGAPRQDYCWGPVADNLKYHGAPGMLAPDSLLSQMTPKSPEGEEVAVYDSDRVNIIGETRPRYVMMDKDIHETMSPKRDQAETTILDDCFDEVGDLYDAATELDECEIDCDDEEAAMISARRSVEECADDNIGGEYRRSAVSLGGEGTFEEFKGALGKYEFDPTTTDEFRRGLLGDEQWPPEGYRDPMLAHERISESLESGYVAPRSDINIGAMMATKPTPPERGEQLNVALVRDAVLQYKDANPMDDNRSQPSFWKKNTDMSRASRYARPISGRGAVDMRRR